MFGVNPWKLMTWMGHKRIDETMLYVNFAGNHLRQLPHEIITAPQTELDPDRRIVAMLGARGTVVALEDSNPLDASSGSKRERVAATEIQHLPAPKDRASEAKTIQMNVACTNVPNATITVADALAILQAAPTRKDQARTLRRALLAALAALETEE